MDDITFFGPSVPQQVRALIPLLDKVSQQQFRKALQVAVEYLKGAEISDRQFEQLSKTLSLPKDIFAAVFTGLYYIIRAAIRNKSKIDVFQNLLKELNIPQAFAADLVKVLQTSRAALEAAVLGNKISLPTLDKLTWRVDVVISTSSMSRVMKPRIVLSMVLSDGNIKTFEISIEKFHELRFNVSKLLKDVEELERQPILKIDV
eukprot:TRINITY_DN5439_c0_g1_i1.p1 TRINITY_DN5439_c0_g1~~TRINITY_DN5439_c0_g1_i1.p1  ORF type:complete len:204 (+),score=45.33 TRINITY_DN5439_c0_g1_i1:185-796(+)